MKTKTAKPFGTPPPKYWLEAIDVYNSIGLTPRQLADQRAELMAALRNLVDRMAPSGYTMTWDAAKKALARAKAQS